MAASDGATANPPEEPLGDFRERARVFLAENLPRMDAQPGVPRFGEARMLQATLFDGGFAGIAFPRKYGGAGLSLEHQVVFAQEAAPYRMPTPLGISVAMLGATLLDCGSEVLKARHIPAILRGDEVWLQLLSEPSGGSDMAAAMTRATHTGDGWLINGAKTWTTGSDNADYGMCLARTNLDVPKHSGLSMFALPLDAAGVTIEPIRSARGGPAHFFQEFFDDVRLSDDSVIGDVNDGWAVAHRLLYHERNATAGVGHGRGYGRAEDNQEITGTGIDDLLALSRAAGTVDDPVARQLLAEAHISAVTAEQVSDRVMTGLRTGAFTGQWGSLLKLGMGIAAPRRGEIGLAIAGASGVTWAVDASDDCDFHASRWLTSRDIAIAGGTNEMQRNIVSERLLGMPRERAFDRDVAFRQVIDRRARSGDEES